jgi:Fe(3+) dicitrate transport protein
VIIQPGMKVDPNLKDVKGYNFDIGYRGQFGNIVNFDFSAFYLLYKNRIGTLLQVDGNTDIYQYETNISDSRSLGTETYVDVNILHLWPRYRHSSDRISLFGSLAYTDARYINTGDNPQRKKFEGKKVEYAAPWIGRFGLDWQLKRLGGSVQYSYTDAEFSDATNAASSTDGSVGIIPAYHTIDLTANYSFSKKWLLSLTANNLTNTMYFTRRTTGFPGPGIIPSEGRSFYATLQFKL